MPRYILIENYSGYIWGDSAEFAPDQQNDLTPVTAAKLMDEGFGDIGRVYEGRGPNYRPAANGGAYHVYRADLGGDESEAVPVVHDGQDAETIEAVERDCEKVAVVTFDVREDK